MATSLAAGVPAEAVPASEYEQERAGRIARNQAMLSKLGIEENKPAAAPAKRKRAKRPALKRAAAPRAEGSRRSKRSAGASAVNYNEDKAFADQLAEAEAATTRAEASSHTRGKIYSTQRRAKAPKSSKGAAWRKDEDKTCVGTGKSTCSGVRAEVLPGKLPLPKRNKHGELVFKDQPDFRPNKTPKEVLQLGAFGGTYFRPIFSGLSGQKLTGAWKEFPAEWFEGLDVKTKVAAPWRSYDESANLFGVKCGGDLNMWESSGWMSTIDPYGWFQWYCRYYLGRRSTDDARQVARGKGCMGSKGRFRNQLIGKIARSGAKLDDITLSPVIRQSLLHWGYVLTKRDADAYCKLKGLPVIVG